MALPAKDRSAILTFLLKDLWIDIHMVGIYDLSNLQLEAYYCAYTWWLIHKHRAIMEHPLPPPFLVKEPIPAVPLGSIPNSL